VRDGVDEEGEAEDVGEEDEFLSQLAILRGEWIGVGWMYLAHVCAYLPDLCEELYA